MQSPGNTQEQKGHIRVCQKTSNKASEVLESDSLTDVTKIDDKIMGRKKVWRGKGPVHDPNHVSNVVEVVLWWCIRLYSLSHKPDATKLIRRCITV